MSKKGSEQSIVSVGNVQYRWSVERQPQWCTADGWRGLLVSVELAEEPCRQLWLQLPFKIQERRSTPHRQRPKLNQSELETYIRQALEAGWDPESRGKAFVFEVENA